MKQLTCEMCDSTDFIKQDGVFVCQSCGCKYSVEEAKQMLEGASTEDTLQKAAELFAKKYVEETEAARKDGIYNEAKGQMFGSNVLQYEEVIKKFESISGWKDSDEQIEICKNTIEEIKAKAEAERLEAARKKEAELLRLRKVKKNNRGLLLVYLALVGVSLLLSITSPIIGEILNPDYLADAIKNAMLAPLVLLLICSATLSLFFVYFLVVPRSKRKAFPLVLLVITLLTAGTGVLLFGWGLIGEIVVIVSDVSTFSLYYADSFGAYLGTVIINAATIIGVFLIKRRHPIA